MFELTCENGKKVLKSVEVLCKMSDNFVKFSELI